MAARLDHILEKSNIYAELIPQQKFAVIPAFALDSGHELKSCPIAYRTWGVLNEKRDNVLVICHALSGSSDVEDWWGPLMGPGKAFDYTRYFIFCGNLMGSPYGSASPLTTNPETGHPYGPEFPETCIRDDIRAHKMVLDALGVISIAAIVGGSMGGMAALEWPLCTPTGYVKNVIPIATSADHSAWGISWAEAQRQCIYADPKYDDGYYEPTPAGQPSTGLATARIVAMLTYRSCVSFDNRFGRKPPPPPKSQPKLPASNSDSSSDCSGLDQNPECDAFRSAKRARIESSTNRARRPSDRTQPPTFSAQGYLQYQGEKFVRRFDANCYIHLTCKMDSHDVARARTCGVDQQANDEALSTVLKGVPPGALVVSVETDTLFCPDQQRRLARLLPDATLAVLKSDDGHDGFLLEFEALNELVVKKLRERCSWVYEGSPLMEINGELQVVKDSIFGEVESAW
ncbi:MAG: hypothetical protein M1827_002181 [Pycnora praestabilis]|nr:MAG: hypothetical protein M1827_002181 [Pycnora praestabilis]